jgi:hypothetical protein
VRCESTIFATRAMFHFPVPIDCRESPSLWVGLHLPFESLGPGLERSAERAEFLEIDLSSIAAYFGPTLVEVMRPNLQYLIR